MLPPGRGPVRRQCGALIPGACPLVTYVRTYVFFPDLRPAKAISQAGYAAKGTSQDTYVRTYVESSSLEVTHHVLGRCLLGSPFYWSARRRRRRATTTTTTGGGLGSNLRTVACVRTWRMFPRPYARTHTLRGSVHACERYVQLNDSCTYVRSWWPLPFWPNAISADFNSRYVRTYALFSLPIIPGLSRSCYSWIETGVETATRSSWVETGVMFVHVVEAVRGSRRL